MKTESDNRVYAVLDGLRLVFRKALYNIHIIDKQPSRDLIAF